MGKRRVLRVLVACTTLAGLSDLASGADLFVSPGGVYSEVHAAIAAAGPGDRIFVAPGQYEGFTLDKPLEIRGAGPGLTQIGHFDSPATSAVTGIPAGATATISDMSFDPAWFATQGFGAQLAVVDNPGTVVVQNVRINQSPTAWHIGDGMVASNTGRLVIQGSTIEGISTAAFPVPGESGLVAQNCLLEVSDTHFLATNAGTEFGDPGPAGADLESCVARFARVAAIGGTGSGSEFFDGPGGAGVKLESCQFVLAGGPSNEARGAWGPTTGGPGLDVTANSTVTLAADVFLQGGINGDGSGHAPGLDVDASSTSTTLARNLPALAATPQTVPVGTSFTLEHTGEPGGVAIPVFSALLGPPFPIEGMNALLHLDLFSLFALGAVALDGTGFATTTGPVPPNPSLAGAHVWFQAVELTGGETDLSNPARLELAL